jgi:hypothetical protein
MWVVLPGVSPTRIHDSTNGSYSNPRLGGRFRAAQGEGNSSLVLADYQRVSAAEG